MATLVLQTAGSMIGGLAGGPAGAAIGSVIGSSLGSIVDQSLTGALSGGGGAAGTRRLRQGPRLKDLDGISATEGAAIPRLYGRARLGGQIIWATHFEEEAVLSTARPRSGKGLSRRAQGRPQTEVSYRYSANVAIGLCEGEIAFVRRVWADGKLLDLTSVTMRVHTGTEEQTADPLIVAKQGATAAPAYRGLAYVVFEKLQLADYGNRLPQMTFEVVRPVHGLCKRIRAVNLIPGAGESVYEPGTISQQFGLGRSSLPNRTQTTHISDWHASLDALQALCPNLTHVALVVSWFGDDLRAGSCQVRPLAEPDSVDGYPHSWSVAGLTRATAGKVSKPDGKPAYGGTPSDASVMRAIRDLKARGLSVTLYPFLMMDIPPDNTRSDPWTGSALQPAYPWRGRITCDPAPGQPSTVEGSVGADQQVNVFFGTCAASSFSVGTDTVTYSGPAEWTLRRLVLHCAALGKAAGGVDAITLCSELIGLTRVRGTGATNPAVAGLKSLAAEVRALLGAGTRITYGADWTEYGAEVRDGGADVRFPLDPLWSDANIDAVAIDWYPPVTDWRDGLSHADALAYDGPYDPHLFRDRIAGGEAFDWYYADAASRAAQVRQPITDGAFNKPWVFRQKDLVSWWSETHRPRMGGSELAPTGWQPGMKPIWLLEAGCPAVDRGANQPNVFPDPKSSESALPHASRGGRDDLVQARHLTALIDHFDPDSAYFLPAHNPSSTVYNGRMLDVARLYLWSWDSRPFPAFPSASSQWADGENYEIGHWLNGRLEGAPLCDLFPAILEDFGADVAWQDSGEGMVEGYVLDRPMSARAALEPLADLFSFDIRAARGQIVALRRGALPVATLTPGTIAVERNRDQPLKTRAQSSELPVALSLATLDPEIDFRQAIVRARVQDSASQREAAIEMGAAVRRPLAYHCAAILLEEARTARETLEFALPQSRIALEPGDTVEFEDRAYRLRRVEEGPVRRFSAVAIEPAHYIGSPPPATPRRRLAPKFAGPPLAVVLDWPLVESDSVVLQRLAVTADPWPGAFTLWKAEDSAASAFAPVERVSTRAVIGTLKTELPAGPLWRRQRGVSIDVELSHGQLQSVSTEAMLAGNALFAIGHGNQRWEAVGYDTAVLIGPRTWRLSGLLRGLGGSEPLAGEPVATGAQIVMLDESLVPLATGSDTLGRTGQYRLAPESRDHGDPLAIAFSATPGPAALLPLAPVGMKAWRDSGDVHLSWLRRCRSGGDNWDLADVPLDEAVESYSLEIMAGAVVKRSMTVGAAHAIYPAADELADFGSPRSSLTLRVRQISQTVGPGHTAEFTVVIR